LPQPVACAPGWLTYAFLLRFGFDGLCNPSLKRERRILFAHASGSERKQATWSGHSLRAVIFTS
jgi:hypothetical protein